MTDQKYKREDCMVLLQKKYRELEAQGLSRFPQRSDFEEREVVAIKSFLGPWPRALEAAGVKPPREDDRAQKNKEKRVCAKRKRTTAKREQRRTCPKCNGEGGGNE